MISRKAEVLLRERVTSSLFFRKILEECMFFSKSDTNWRLMTKERFGRKKENLLSRFSKMPMVVEDKIWLPSSK